MKTCGEVKALDEGEFVRTPRLVPAVEGFLLPSGWEAGWDLYHVGKLWKSEKLSLPDVVPEGVQVLLFQ
jgi:hypothetical protein